MNVLIVSPHPDDETLGAGGTLLKYKNENKNIYWLNITNIKSEYGYNKEKVEKRQKEIKKVIDMYKFNGVFDLGLCPTNLENYSSSEVIQEISNIIKKVEPSIIILPNRSDVHSDHKIVFDWCYSCTKIFRYPYIKKIITMEVLSETDFALNDNGFLPNYFIDITEFFDEKIKILNIYESELNKHPFPRSVDGLESLAKIRGIAAGTRYAEAFKIIKMIE